MASVTLTDIKKDADGTVRFRFGKTEKCYDSVASAVADIRQRFDKNDMMLIAIALCLTRQPSLNNVAQLINHTLTVDLTLANWGTIV